MTSGTTVCDLGSYAAGATPSYITGQAALEDVGPETIAIPFPVASGYVLVASSLTVGGAGQFTLGGAGSSGLAIDPSFAPVIEGDGKTVVYHVIGQLNASGGDITVTFVRQTWSVELAGQQSAITDPGTATESCMSYRHDRLRPGLVRRRCDAGLHHRRRGARCHLPGAVRRGDQPDIAHRL